MSSTDAERVEVELALLLGALDHFPQAVGARVRPTSAAVAVRFDLPENDAGRRAPATNRPRD